MSALVGDERVGSICVMLLNGKGFWIRTHLEIFEFVLGDFDGFEPTVTLFAFPHSPPTSSLVLIVDARICYDAGFVVAVWTFHWILLPSCDRNIVGN